MSDATITWEAATQAFRYPDWWATARLGIWVHWGPQSQPRDGGGWYARHMYMPDVGDQTWGKNAYPYHCTTYGHPSQAGFKDVIHEWTADKLDTDALVQWAATLGAQYFIAMANHHDHFDNWNSVHHRWNSVNVGPKRDLIGEFATSARKAGLPFGISSHDDRMLMYYEHAFDADSEGPYAGKPYDGRLTKADGAGTWWDGLDPMELYGPPPEARTEEWVEAMKANWLDRHTQLVQDYQPDIVWFDGYGFPYGEYGKELCRRYYAAQIAQTGHNTGLVIGKIDGESAVIDDIERGVADSLREDVWQATTTFTGWFYKDERINHSAQTLVETLIECVSKNGNLLLNIEPYGDGSMPPDHTVILEEFGRWVRAHEVAIFQTRPWHVFGDNLGGGSRSGRVGVADLEAVAAAGGEHFNGRTVDSPPFPHHEVRFAARDGHLYVFVLNPADGDIELPAVVPDRLGASVTAATVLGGGGDVAFEQRGEALVLTIPSARGALPLVIDLALG